ncbi:unnamed protein product [Oppiella nova]|uniref:CAAX prenyl protease 2 n=1 Tax=Oppiella nova TaxID=334625 RepID=A0A7R9L9M1_9ACAR|nr:unnamed protein product [Oppiella nova]CAG2161031.1 unnamed protein product [Oppiella nova]
MDTCIITSTILSCLVSFLYVGSLYCWPKQTHRIGSLAVSLVIRNYMIAPITEELIFRGVLSTLLVKCWSLRSTLIMSSLLFGFSHSHHYIFEINDMRRVTARNYGPALEQMTYTTLFGMYASVVYFKSRLIISPILVHSFCNLMGFPDLGAITSSKHTFALTLTGFLLWLLSVFYVYSNL